MKLDEIAAQPRRKGGLRRLLRGACLAGLVIASGCKPKAAVYAPPPPPDVTVDHPVRRSVTRYLENTGSTEAFEAVELRARVAGFLEEVRFRPGSAVKKGDLLFVIDPRVYEAKAQQEEAEVATREATLRLAEITLARVTEAAKSAAASKQEVDTATAQRDEALAQLNLSKAALANAKLNVEFTQVRSPIDGRITKNFVDVGNLVGEGQATVLATIVRSQPIYVSIDTSETNVIAIRRERMAKYPGAEPGQITPGEWRPVDLATVDTDEFAVHGHIDYVDPSVNPQTGTIRVRCRFENEDGLLLPGMFVRLRVQMETTDAMLVPDTALLTDQFGRFALVVNEKDIVELRRVKIGQLDGTMRVVQSGLSESDRIIVNGLQRARAGMSVKPSPPASPPQSGAPSAAPKAGGG